MFKQLVYLYIIFAFVEQMSCFFGRNQKDGNVKTKTHRDITFAGTFSAINKYIVDNKGSSSIDDFFKNDYDSKFEMAKKVNMLGGIVSNIQENRRSTAYYHCNANQIDLAHSFVKSCKTKLNHWKDDTDELLRQIGSCLYTVQSFYSNTNWIEMYGEVVYKNFGVGYLMNIASGNDDSCLDMSDPRFGCEDNIRTDKLTSGYHSGRGNTKPTRSINSTSGPCSHGGPEDSSRNMIAKCGINKDSVSEIWSPHYHLHDAAYRAAVKATEEFLVGTDTGILYTLGQSIFDQLFHTKVRVDVSLAFAVDFSGSMWNDIAAVKEYIINLVYSTMGSANEPANYVLSLFNDPEYLHQDFVHTSGTDMIATVESIIAVGGDDCPEYAAAGILKAIELAKPGSTVLTFTDASAKDEDRVLEVVSAAFTKNITLTPLLTGTCTSFKRKKRDIMGRTKREIYSFYQQIADATGGKVYYTSKHELGTILTQVLETIFPSSEIIIDSFSWPSASSTEKDITIDDSITVLTIKITGSTAATDVEIRYENGTIETFTSSTANRIYTDGREIIISLQNPPPSTLKLAKNVDNAWNVNITAQSSLKADVELLQYALDGNLISLQGSPVIGNNCSVSWTVYNLGGNGTCDVMTTVATNGTLISSFSTSSVESDFSYACSSDIHIPEQPFKFKLMGMDSSGYTYSRKISTTFVPSFVELTMADSNDEVVVGHETAIGFNITNVAGYSNTYRVSITDNYGYVVSASSIEYFIGGRESENGTFIINPTTASVIISYSITVTETATSKVEQIITKKLLVIDVKRPVCSVISSVGTCRTSSLDSGNCSSQTWTASAEVTFSGTTLNNISTSAGPYVVLIHDNINYLLSSPFAVNVTGDCCYSTVHLDVTDIDGYIAQCEITISTDIQSTDDGSMHVVAIVIGVLVPIVVTTIVATVARYYYSRQSKKSKIQDSCPNIQQDEEGNAKDNWIDDHNIRPESLFKLKDICIEDIYE